MSRYVAALVYRKKVGSMARKAILAYCAERASDDGSGIWCSKVTISKEVECSKKTVIETLSAFVEEGLMFQVGKRKVSNGYVHVYQINIPAVERLESAISYAEMTGVNLNPSPEVTPRGEVGLPQEVTSVHPNRPKTVLKPSNIPIVPSDEDQLFKVSEEPQESDGKAEAEEGFKEFWDKIWPSHHRKAAKAKCQKVYIAACLGKHPNAEQISPADLNRCARAFVEQERGNENFKYLPGPLPWLNKPGWEPFLDKPLEFRIEDLTENQRKLLEEGTCPPSMLDDEGKPNAAAIYWLKRFGHVVIK